MKRSLCIGATMAFALSSAFSSLDQFPENVERNLTILNQIQGCSEGFASEVAGSSMLYSSFRPDPERALITRATSGEMAIIWKTQPAPAAIRGGNVDFVVMAGMYGQTPSGFRFRMFINNVHGFDFVTTPTEQWTVHGKEGGALQFIGATKDKFGDLFGYLRITLPVGWLRPGEPVECKVVGEKANSAAWLMVFEVTDVVAYQQAMVNNEAFCSVQFRPAGTEHTISVFCPSSWDQKELLLTFGSQPGRLQKIGNHNGAYSAVFAVGNEKISSPMTISVDGGLVMRLDSIFVTVSKTLVYPRKLVSLSAAPPDAKGWDLTYRATYQPSLGSSLQEFSTLSNGTGTQHLIISTHQDIAWMDSPENCIRDRDEKIITPLLAIMKNDPAYCFDLEDVLCLREYLDRHPDRKGEISRYIQEGRLGIGASFNQPYEDLCSAEMLVRQFHAGKRWLRTHFPGCNPRTYWNPDVPGRTLQMPQVMAKSDVKYLTMSRFSKGLYSWLSLDGSRILAFSPGHYGDFKARVEGTDFERAAGYIASASTDWLKSTRFISHEVPLLSMSDMSGPDRYDTFLARWNTLTHCANDDGSLAPLSLPPVRPSRIETYLDAVVPHLDGMPVIDGDRPNIWLYIHGPTHHKAISAKREADVSLPAAEIFSTVDALLAKSFASYPHRELNEAWEAQLYPDHGWGGKNGDITDSTFKAKYETARDISTRVLSRSLVSIASRVKTPRASGLPIVVFNSLSWQRSGPVEMTITLKAGVARDGVSLYSAKGKGVPLQSEIVQRHPDGSIRSVKLVFVASDVPSVGYLTYYLRPSSEMQRTQPVPLAGDAAIENSFYRLELAGGGVRQILDKEMNELLLTQGKFLGGELFTMQSVGEDAGEWDEPQQPTMEGFDKLSNHPVSWERVESGPVREIVEGRYTMQHASVVQRIILYRMIKRIDLEVSLLGWDGTRYREFRLAFPVGNDGSQVAYEVPFGVVEIGRSEMKGSAGERYKQTVARVRPRAIQHWIGSSGQRIGVTLSSSVAVWDYRDPTDSATVGPLLQPVLLASRRSCHGAGPWYLQQGDHHYRFSLTSHEAGWQNGQRQGIEANTPLLAVADISSDARAHLAESGSFLSIDSDASLLSTMKKAEDDNTVIVRVYNTTGMPTDCRVTLSTPVRKAEETNLLEDAIHTMPHSVRGVALTAGKYAITTMKLTPQW